MSGVPNLAARALPAAATGAEMWLQAIHDRLGDILDRLDRLPTPEPDREATPSPGPRLIDLAEPVPTLGRELGEDAGPTLGAAATPPSAAGRRRTRQRPTQQQRKGRD